MDRRPIGVFDSGLGGLTAVKQLMALLPGEDIVYFGDTGRVPYGSRSRETIIQYTKDDIAFLLGHDIKLIIAACGTASSVALETVRPLFPVPVVGVVEPACLTAARGSAGRRIGVIGTTGTVRSGKYADLLTGFDPRIRVFSAACPLFVPLVENGYTKGAVPAAIAKDYLAPIKEAGVDTLILGCTHYPLLKGVIADIMGGGVSLVDSGAETAEYVKGLLESADMLSDKSAGGCKFFVSDSVENFAHAGSLFLGKEIDLSVQRVKEF